MSDEKVVPRWHPNDTRPYTVAYAAENSDSHIPWSGTEYGDTIEDFLKLEVERMKLLNPAALRYLGELTEMYADAFSASMQFTRANDPDAFDLFCAMCAYTHAVTANVRPI